MWIERFLIESVIITISIITSITKCYKYTSISKNMNSIQSAVNKNFYNDIKGEAHTLIKNYIYISENLYISLDHQSSKKVGYVNLQASTLFNT